jgi:DNA polymerase-3 subunit alpha
MTTEMGNTEKTVFNVAECRRSGIPLLPPDVNRSKVDFSVEVVDDRRQAVRFGLGAVKNVGVGAVTAICQARDESATGTLSTLDAFCDAVDWSGTNKRVVESLVKAGALDCYGHRAAVLASLEQAVGAAQKRQKAAARGQMDLFGMLAEDPVGEGPASLQDVPEADAKQVLEWEKEFLGLYLSSHPLTSILGSGVPAGYRSIADIADCGLGEKARVIGMATSVRRITTRKNQTMAIVEAEDLTGTLEFVAFPETYERIAGLLEPDAILVLTGKVEERGDRRQVVLESASDSLPELNIRPRSALTVVIRVPLTGEYWQDVDLMQRLDQVLQQNPGDAQVVLVMSDGGRPRRLRSRSRQIAWVPEVSEEIEELLGQGAAWVDGEVTGRVEQDRGGAHLVLV